jgi:hypothetical protein
LNKPTNFFCKRCAFRCGNPFQSQTAFINSQQPEQLAGFFNDLPASYITFQVMAVADVSAGNQDAVRPFQESLEQEPVIQPAGAHESDQTDIGWILHAGHPCQVSPGISAPVADKSQYFRFGVRRHGISELLEY